MKAINLKPLVLFVFFLCLAQVSQSQYRCGSWDSNCHEVYWSPTINTTIEADLEEYYGSNYTFSVDLSTLTRSIEFGTSHPDGDIEDMISVSHTVSNAGETLNLVINVDQNYIPPKYKQTVFIIQHFVEVDVSYLGGTPIRDVFLFPEVTVILDPLFSGGMTYLIPDKDKDGTPEYYVWEQFLSEPIPTSETDWLSWAIADSKSS
ncbi:MAG: hypothetical protein PQJ49_00355, partial [Sphaerochaetaceae bacterium]|nr:hypothetical protein [Sphaerochaetaceae bacterium]